mgnify:CR=1 FL=1
MNMFARLINISAAALAGAMHDPVRHAAQRNHRAGLEGRRLRQPAETRGNPAAMHGGKFPRLRDGAARRHGEDRGPIGRMDAERVTSRAPVPPELDREELRAVPDHDGRGFGGPPVEERASSHIWKSGEE